MKIDVFFTPFFPETELMFNDKYVVMIDVFRASTTVCSILNNQAKEIIFCETIDKAVNIFNSLSKESRVLGGERNGFKPDGFDAGNSPSEYNVELVKGKSVIISTTNGTKVFSKAKDCKKKLIAGFVNLNAITETLITDYNNSKFEHLIILCAGTNGRFSTEDTICAGAYIMNFFQILNNVELTDSAKCAMDIFVLHSIDLINYLKSCEHAAYLIKNGFEKDVELCLSNNAFPVVPLISGNSIKLI